jgi:hypothetical protein
MISLLLLSGLILTSLFTQALFLWLGARWAKVTPEIRFRRAAGVTFAVWLVSMDRFRVVCIEQGNC